ncbi:MAG: histidine phosphatase family protein, partial [Microbacterium gubbeenense]
WIEHGLGEWEGCTPDAIGPDYARWRAGEVIPPGGEPVEEIRHRVTGAVRRAAAHPGPVLVVTHGGTIRAVLDRFVGLAPGRLDPVVAPSLTVIDMIDDDAARLRSFNLTA